ncbi:MAG: hypothetical protein ABL977_11670 [Candidatus Eisenbacteria bacterium]
MTEKKPALIHELITRSFRDRNSAERAFEAIAKRGTAPGQISVLLTSTARTWLFPKAIAGTDVGIQAREATADHTPFGEAAAAATLLYPDLGLLVAGPLSSSLPGSLAGTASGGLVGVLMQAGISETRAKTFAIDLRDGAVVLAVQPLTDDDAGYFTTEWQPQKSR